MRETLQSGRRDHPEEFHGLVLSLLTAIEKWCPLEYKIDAPDFPVYGFGSISDSSPPAPVDHKGVRWMTEHSQLLFGYPISP